jgi:adenosine/AMP kinase
VADATRFCYHVRELQGEEETMEVKTIPISFPEGTNIIFGQSHFIKTVEDLYEIMISSAPGAAFGVAFCEASGPCLIRRDGNDDALVEAATDIAESVGAGHSFIIVMKDAFPINALNAVKACQEVCGVYCATANPVEVVVAETAQGRGVLGVVDGSGPDGVESPDDVKARREFLRKIGYKR